jgi:hypothetical protein
MKTSYLRIVQKSFAIFLVLAFASLAGCTTDEVREERTVTAPGTAVTTTPATTTTVVEKETIEEENTSVLGTVFDVIGEVIALPFRLVAGIFRFVF